MVNKYEKYKNTNEQILRILQKSKPTASTIEKLLKKNDINPKDDYYNLAITRVIKDGRLDILKKLLGKKGAKPTETKYLEGNDNLFYSLYESNKKMECFLYDFYINLDKNNNKEEKKDKNFYSKTLDLKLHKKMCDLYLKKDSLEIMSYISSSKKEKEEYTKQIDKLEKEINYKYCFFIYNFDDMYNQYPRYVRNLKNFLNVVKKEREENIKIGIGIIEGLANGKAIENYQPKNKMNNKKTLPKLNGAFDVGYNILGYLFDETYPVHLNDFKVANKTLTGDMRKIKKVINMRRKRFNI